MEIPQGSKVDIQGLLCSIPQEGYVLNAIKVLDMIQEAYVNGHIDYQMPADNEVVV